MCKNEKKITMSYSEFEELNKFKDNALQGKNPVIFKSYGSLYSGETILFFSENEQIEQAKEISDELSKNLKLCENKIREIRENHGKIQTELKIISNLSLYELILWYFRGRKFLF